jgi:hypothetical protein
VTSVAMVRGGAGAGAGGGNGGLEGREAMSERTLDLWGIAAAGGCGEWRRVRKDLESALLGFRVEW